MQPISGGSSSSSLECRLMRVTCVSAPISAGSRFSLLECRSRRARLVSAPISRGSAFSRLSERSLWGAAWRGVSGLHEDLQKKMKRA
jgi:hypothetical protein